MRCSRGVAAGIAACVLGGCFGGGNDDAVAAGSAAVGSAAAGGTGGTGGNRNGFVGDPPIGAGAGAGGVAGAAGAAAAAAAGTGGGFDNAGAGGSGGFGMPPGGGAGAGGTGGMPVMAGVGGVAGVGGSTMACASVSVQAAVRTPTLMFVISAAASMGSSFDGTTRWDAVRDALLAPGGPLYPREGRLRMSGLFIWGQQGACLQAVMSPLSTFVTELDAAYPASTGGFLPGEAGLTFAYEQIRGDPDVVEPRVVWIADSPPIACDGETDDTEATADALAAGLGSGVETTVVQLGSAAAAVTSSASLAAASGGPAFVADTRETLAAVLEAIVTDAASCVIDLNGRVTLGRECEGAVEFNGNLLECNGENGFVLNDDSSLALVGSACDGLTSGADALVRVDFPCEVFTPD